MFNVQCLMFKVQYVLVVFDFCASCSCSLIHNFITPWYLYPFFSPPTLPYISPFFNALPTTGLLSIKVPGLSLLCRSLLGSDSCFKVSSRSVVCPLCKRRIPEGLDSIAWLVLYHQSYGFTLGPLGRPRVKIDHHQSSLE